MKLVQSEQQVCVGYLPYSFLNQVENVNKIRNYFMLDWTNL